MNKKSLVLVISIIILTTNNLVAHAQLSVDPNSNDGWTWSNGQWIGGVAGAPKPELSTANYDRIALPDGTFGVSFDCVSQGSAHLVLRLKADAGVWRTDQVAFKN